MTTPALPHKSMRTKGDNTVEFSKQPGWSRTSLININDKGICEALQQILRNYQRTYRHGRFQNVSGAPPVLGSELTQLHRGLCDKRHDVHAKLLAELIPLGV